MEGTRLVMQGALLASVVWPPRRGTLIRIGIVGGIAIGHFWIYGHGGSLRSFRGCQINDQFVTLPLQEHGSLVIWKLVLFRSWVRFYVPIFHQISEPRIQGHGKWRPFHS